MTQAIAILYATRNGYTRHIAERLAVSVLARGFDAQVFDAAHIPAGFSLQRYNGAILAASVCGGVHEREVNDFVKLHITKLENMPAAFLSVTHSEAGLDSQVADDAERVIHRFLAETGWRAQTIKAVAAALLCTQCGFLVRFVMKGIGKEFSSSTDYTDWTALDHFAGEFLAEEAARAAV
jgi:menaquinone-dependent protoporphyrinogen oxidase